MLGAENAIRAQSPLHPLELDRHIYARASAHLMCSEIIGETFHCLGLFAALSLASRQPSYS